jgi:predicted dehydrogenase
MFKVAIIGIGRIVTEGHLPAVVKFKHSVKLVSLCNSNNVINGRALAKKFDTKHYSDYKEMIETELIDLIIIASHARTHFEIAKHCIEKKINILVEKPLTLTLQESLFLETLKKTYGVYVFVSFQRRVHPFLDEIKKCLLENRLGDIIYSNCESIHHKSHNYYAKKLNGLLDGGGVLINQAIHSIDLLNYCFGEISLEEAHGYNFKHEMGFPDSCSLRFTHRSKTIINFFATTASGFEQNYSLSIIGTNGFAVFSPITRIIKYQGKDEIIFKDEFEYSNLSLISDQLELVINTIKDNSGDKNHKLCSIGSSLISLKIVEQAQTLMELKKYRSLKRHYEDKDF